MKFTQKRHFFVSTHFDFKDDKLEFLIKDVRQDYGFSIHYDDIDSKKSFTTLKEKWPSAFSAVAYIFFVLDVFWISKGFSPVGQGMLATAILFMAIGSFFKVDATLIPTEMGNIVILPDKNHDKIVSEIFSRRRDVLKNIYGIVNPLNHPENEINRFRWLRDEDIITPSEFEAAYKLIYGAIDNQGMLQ